jgi:hypothetical protein
MNAKILSTLSVLLFICINFNLFGQHEKELIKQLTKANEKEKIQIYEELIQKNLKKNPKKAFYYANEKLKLCVKNGLKKEEIETCLSIGIFFSDQGLHDSSMVYIKRALTLELKQKKPT